MTYLKKNRTISEIKNTLKDKIEMVYIIGSFQNEEWNQYKSDIDLVCIDSSFIEFPYFTNLYYVRNYLTKIPYKFDLFLYTWKQFYTKMKENPIFSEEIRNSVKL